MHGYFPGMKDFKVLKIVDDVTEITRYDGNSICPQTLEAKLTARVRKQSAQEYPCYSGTRNH